MVPIDSARMVSYSTFIDTIIVSVTIFATFGCNFDDLEVGQFKIIQDQNS